MKNSFLSVSNRPTRFLRLNDVNERMWLVKMELLNYSYFYYIHFCSKWTTFIWKYFQKYIPDPEHNLLLIPSSGIDKISRRVTRYDLSSFFSCIVYKTDPSVYVYRVTQLAWRPTNPQAGVHPTVQPHSGLVYLQETLSHVTHWHRERHSGNPQIKGQIWEERSIWLQIGVLHRSFSLYFCLFFFL